MNSVFIYNYYCYKMDIFDDIAGVVVFVDNVIVFVDSVVVFVAGVVAGMDR